MQQPSRRTWWNQCAQPKPVGGYRLIKARDLCLVWTFFVAGRISRRAMNAYFACHEVLERRRWLEPGRTPKFTAAELERLTGGGERSARRAVRELERAGLLRGTRTALEFLAPEDEPEDLDEMLEALGGRSSLVPVPRQVLRLLAGTTRVRTATILGHMLRLLHGGGRRSVRCTGLVKASWIAETFGVSARAVKRDRRELIELGLLTSVETPQWVLNRHGARFTWNLEWSRPTAAVENSADVGEGTTPVLTPPTPQNEPVLSPPIEVNRNLPTEGTHQNPASRAPGSSKKKLKKSNLKHIVLEDLRDDSRLLALFAEATRSELVSGSEAERLRFFSAAEHALAVGSRNAPGLFAWLLRTQRFEFCTQADEDSAHARIRRAHEGREERPAAKVPRDPVTGEPRHAEPAAAANIVESLLARFRSNLVNSSDSKKETRYAATAP